jgi:hypothetical protein
MRHPAFKGRDPLDRSHRGHLDDVTTPQQIGVSRHPQSGLRACLWKPSDQPSIRRLPFGGKREKSNTTKPSNATAALQMKVR